MFWTIFFSRSQASILFIALALGYIVLYFAHREEKPLKLIGYLIGVLIIASCGLLLFAKFSLRMKTLFDMRSGKASSYYRFMPYNNASGCPGSQKTHPAVK